MAFLGLQVPHETGRLLSEIDVPGERESVESFHITLLYLGEKVPMETVAKAMVVTEGVTASTTPFTVRTRLVTCFPKNEAGVPIICRVESDALHEFRAELAAAFDREGIEYSKRFPEYKPHVTLAYSDELIFDESIPTVEWGAHESVLWAGDRADGRLTITFPFSLHAPKVTSIPPERAVAARFLGGR